MKAGAYGLFEIVAWPAAAWYPAEAVLRGLEGEGGKAAFAALAAVLAAGMIVLCRHARATGPG